MKLFTPLIAASAVLISGSVGFFCWSKTASFTLFRIGYLGEPLKEHVDAEAISTHFVDTAVSSLLQQQVSTSSNQWEVAGSVFAAGLVESMKPALKAQTTQQVNDGIVAMQQLIDKGDRSFFKGIRKESGEVVATINRDGESVDVVMDREDGVWKFTQFSDESVKAALAKTQPMPTQSSVPEPQVYSPQQEVHTPAMPDPATVAVNPEYQYGFLRADDVRAQINIREQPSANSPSHSYGIVGDKVRVLDRETDKTGTGWYQVYFENSDTLGWVREDLILLDGV